MRRRAVRAILTYDNASDLEELHLGRAGCGLVDGRKSQRVEG